MEAALQKLDIQELAVEHGLTANPVRIGRTHLYFLRRDGALIHDTAMDAGEVRDFLKELLADDGR